ncbi:DUF2975 domain-containing protein [Microbacterium sp. W1N]|uniref:DUF2975 domain-containing protein n=1 Tax=Microbacterium festucae TaxID=2977531 RepID=UPI0021BE8E32|nr:DUF2975 domain-containing protein [Microbacterium festucae]MCT9820955.1 DUF2975 domain-containing protein [Microbacterium festucae]
MQSSTVVAAKIALALIALVTVVAQLVVIPALADSTVSMYPEAAHLRVPGIVGCVALVVCVQVAVVCVWRLLTMVDTASIFTDAAFVWVDALIAAVASFTGLLAAAFVVLSLSAALSPGVMLLLIAGGALALGVTLILVVMKGLLRKASALEHELAEVV